MTTTIFLAIGALWVLIGLYILGNVLFNKKGKETNNIAYRISNWLVNLFATPIGWALFIAYIVAILIFNP